MTEIWIGNHFVSDKKYHIINLECPICFTRNDNIFLGLYLVLVTLHGCFTINTEQDKEKCDTK